MTLTCPVFLVIANVQKLPSEKPIRGVENVPSSLLVGTKRSQGSALMQLVCAELYVCEMCMR